MCMLFLYVAKANSISNSGQPRLKLLIASNRDEAYSRPTNPAKFWDSDPNILAGQDCKEGGTWLGITKTGKLVVLLNIMSKPAENKLSRGDLVTGFLRSDPTLRGWTYCNNLHQDAALDIANRFGLFNLVTIDLLSSSDSDKHRDRQSPTSSSESNPSGSKSCFDVTYLTNASPTGPKTLTEGESEVFVLGNSIYESPFCKASDGCRDFGKIMEAHTRKPFTAEAKAELKATVVNLLKSQERHFPDPQMEKQAKNAEIPITKLPELSSVFVTSGMNYGTRTHTIIMIDSENNVNFHEWTMEDPIDPKNPHWTESQYDFKI